MKSLYTFFVFLSLSFLAASCGKNDDAEPSLIPDGDFARGNVLAFYFYDEEKTNLVEKFGREAFKIEYSQTEASPGFDYSNDVVAIEDESGELYLSFPLRGFKNSLTSTFNLLIPEHTTDQVQIKWWLTDKDVIGGKYHASIESLLYNGTKVHSETDKKAWPGKIVVIKGRSKTSVSTSLVKAAN